MEILLKYEKSYGNLIEMKANLLKSYGEYFANLLELPRLLSLDLAALFACLEHHPQLASFPELRLLLMPALWLRALLRASECFRPLLPNPSGSHTFQQEVVALRLTRATDERKYPQSPLNGCAIRLPIPALAWVAAWHQLEGQIHSGPPRTYKTKAIPRSLPVEPGLRDGLVQALSEVCAAGVLAGEHAMRFAQLPEELTATAKISFRIWVPGVPVTDFAALDPAMGARGLMTRFAAQASLLDMDLSTGDLANLWCPGLPFKLLTLPAPLTYVSRALAEQCEQDFPIRDPQQGLSLIHI